MVTFTVLCALSIIFQGIICQKVVPKYDLTIGIILNANDDITKKVASLAVQKANLELSELNYRLQIKTESIEENASFYAIRKACNLLRHGLIAIISPISAVPSRHVSSLCSKFQIPHLVTTCRFPESMEIYPMDVRVSPDCDQYANIIYQYITRVENWKSMIIIHSSSDCILKFESLINQFEYQLKMRHWIHHDLKQNKELLRELSKPKIHHNFVVDIPYWQIKEFLIMASVHNMTEPEYSFIFTDWDTGIVDISAFKINNLVNITTFSIVNQTAIEYLKSSGSNIDSLMKSVTQTEMSYKMADLNSNFLKAQPAIIFDSINLLVKALVELAKLKKLTVTTLDCLNNETWSLGSSLVNAMTSVDDVYGTTGKILFNDKAQRKEYNVSILELTENGFEKRAFWSEDKITIIPKSTGPSSPENATLTNPLRVTTKIEEPFVFYGDPTVRSNFDPHPSAWKGYCIDLLHQIGLDLNLNFSIHVVADNSYGVSKENETNPDGTDRWTGMIGELLTKKADLVVAPMTITYEREKVVDFTTPFMSLGLSIMFLKPKKETPGLFSFLSPLSPPVWVSVIAAYLGVSLILFFISHITPYECLHSHNCENENRKNQFNLLNSLWFAVGALVRQGCDLAPQASSTRIIVGAWWFFTLIIISTYTANLAAFLTVEQLILPIKSAEDLANQTTIKYGTLKGGASFAFFEKALIPTYKKMYAFMQANPDVLQTDVDTGINRVLNSGGKYAFLMESSWIEYYVQKYCNLMKVGDLLDSKGYGIGFPEGSPLRDRVSVSILKLQKEQILDTLKHRWWNEMNNTEPCNVKEEGKMPEPLKVSQVGGVFVLLGIGFFVGTLISVLELYIRYLMRRLHFTISFGTFMGKELKFAMRFMSSSKKLKNPKSNTNKSKEKHHLSTNPEPREDNLPVNVCQNTSPGNGLNSSNFVYPNQQFIDIYNTDIDQDDLCDSSFEGIPGPRYIWDQPA